MKFITLIWKILLSNKKVDITNITNSEAQRFIKVFLTYRGINRRFFELVPEEKFDFRLTPKSDSVRESLVHLINIENCYLASAEEGDGTEWGKMSNPLLKQKSKNELLVVLGETDVKLMEFLGNKMNLTKKVKVKWSAEPISVLAFLWAMNDHEILHNGWNLALMDMLDIPRYEELKRIWGN